MKKKQTIIILVLLLVVGASHCLISIKKKPQEYNIYLFDEEPSFISTSDNGELLTVVDGRLVFINSQMKSTTIKLEFEVAKVYDCDDWLWVIDNKNNLYTLHVYEDKTYELSDVILKNVDYVTGDASRTIAISTEGYVYIWGNGDEYYSIGLGADEKVTEPIKVEGISHAKEVCCFHVNTAILTETGELYVIGGIISSKWSEERQEFTEDIEYIKEFRKVKCESKISRIGECEGLYTIYEDGTVSKWSGVKTNSDDDIVLCTDLTNWDDDILFSQISFGQSFCVGLDVEKKLYFWGVDFIETRKDKSDYTIYNTPQLIKFSKNVENVYVAGDVAFLKNGLELYVIPDK